MAIEIGSIIEGTVTGVKPFGAFVDLGEGKTGLVHVSEVANEYVEDIHAFVKEQDSVKVKVLSIDGNKIALSIKQTLPKSQAPRHREASASGFHRDDRRSEKAAPYHSTINRRSSDKSFEDKMKSFLRDSEQRLADYRRNTEGKRGGRGGRRG